MDANDDVVKIDINLSEIVNKFYLHLKDLKEIFSHIYYSILISDYKGHIPLPTKALPIYINDNLPPLSEEEYKVRTMKWLLRKSLEDLVAGLNKSLVEAFSYVKFLELNSTNPFPGTKDDIIREIEKINDDAARADFPRLINQIEVGLKKTLKYKDEVISINKLRKCLVHGGGVVRKNDTGTNKSVLTLKYISQINFTEIDGERIILDYDKRASGITVSNFNMLFKSKERTFQIGEEISLEIDDFNEISFTCIQFVSSLLNEMPR